MTARPEPSDLVSVRLDREQGLTEQHHYGFISQPRQRNDAKLLDQLDIPDDTIRLLLCTITYTHIQTLRAQLITLVTG
jgi:hypothetical protein